MHGKNTGASTTLFDAYIERDDVAIGQNTGARQSYFEDADYDTSGDLGSFVDHPDNPSPIRRSGVFNSLSTGRHTIAVGGTRVTDSGRAALAHFARYLKAIVLRLDKVRADPARDAARLAELRPQEQRYWRLVAERKGQVDARMQELRWLLEELRVSFFAQELRTPQPVSTKRLDKLWAQINS